MNLSYTYSAEKVKRDGRLFQWKYSLKFTFTDITPSDRIKLCLPTHEGRGRDRTLITRTGETVLIVSHFRPIPENTLRNKLIEICEKRKSEYENAMIDETHEAHVIA